MAWTQSSPGIYSRPLGGIEQSQVSYIAAERPDAREPIKIHCIADFSAPYATDRVVQALKEGWKALRLLECPDIATTSDGGQKVYKVPSAKEVEVWLSRTFVVVKNDTPTDAAIRATYKEVELLPVCYLIPHSTSDGTFKGTVFLMVSHWRTEAGGAFKALDQLLKHTADLLEGATTKTALSKHKPGDEIQLLTPSIEDILMPNKTSSTASADRISKHMSHYTSHLPCIEFPTSAPLTSPPSSMKRAQRIYTPASTTTLIHASKRASISITATIHSAYLSAIYSIPSLTQRIRSYASMMPAQVRTRLPPSSPYRNQACWSSANMLFLAFPPNQSFHERAHTLRQQYKLADSPQWLYEDAREVVQRTLHPSGETPAGPAAIPWFTAIGLLDGETLQSTHGGISVERATVWADNPGPGIVLGQWSFRGRLNIQIHWNVAFQSEGEINGCLDEMERVLERELGVQMVLEEVRGGDEVY